MFKRGSSSANRRIGVSVARVSLVLPISLALLGCTRGEQTREDAGTTSPTAVAESPSPEPSPAAPPKPKLKDARVEGRYVVALTLIRSNLGFKTDDRARWKFIPVCGAGSCDLTLRSISGSYKERVPFTNGKYRFSHRVPKAYTCGVGSDVDYYITAVRNVTFAVSQMKLIDGVWTATKLSGSEEERGTKGCGLEGLGTSKFSLRARRM